MKKLLPALVVAISMALGGYYLAPHSSQSAAGDVTCATATATVPAITYSDGATRSGTIPGASDTATVCVTEPSPTIPPPPPPPPLAACTYYVSSSGLDTNPGTQAAPWKTTSKVNSAVLVAGNTVCFEGGQSFAGSLQPEESGTASSPINFISYGTGRAKLLNGVWIPGGSYKVFENLDLSNPSAGVFASGSAYTTTQITLRNSVVHDSSQTGVNTAGASADWLIEGNTFRHLGDSCLLVTAPRTVIKANLVTDCGWNSAITYGKHGLYAKAIDLTIADNDWSQISGGQALSIREHGARAYGNTIHDTCCAIAFFDYDNTPAPQGTSYVYNNRLWNITSWGFYYGGQLDPQGKPPSVNFVVASNTFQESSAVEAVNLSEVPSAATVQLANNIFTGSFGSAYRGCATCSEHHNDWNGGTSNIPSGTGDLRVAPNLSAAPELKPLAGSPVIDKGSPTVTGLSYVAICDAQPLHYCGLGPDMGAVEGG